MFSWLKNLWKRRWFTLSIPKPVSEPLPEGKLNLVPCGCCKRPLFYYTHTIVEGLIPIYQNALNLKGEQLTTTLKFKEINEEPCCKYPSPGNIQDCAIVDNPFIKKKRKRRSKNATAKKDSK